MFSNHSEHIVPKQRRSDTYESGPHLINVLPIKEVRQRSVEPAVFMAGLEGLLHDQCK